MSPLYVALCYGSAIAISLFLLWYFGPKAWFFHVLSIVAATVLGLIPLGSPFDGPRATLAVGWLFLLLMIWGIGGPVFAFLGDTWPPLREHRHH